MLFYCYHPKTGSVCPSGGVFFPFVSERKRKQKEREFKGCALKNPPIVQSCYAQSKALCFPFLQLRVALCAMNLYEAEKTKRVCNDITSSVPEPSPRYTVTFGQVGKVSRRSRDGCGAAYGVGGAAITNSVDITHCYRPQTGSVCPSGRVSFSFVSERKRNQKEREFEGLRP